MSDYEHVDLERAGPKTVIRMTDPEKRNRLSQGMIKDLTAALYDAEVDESAAIVLTGTDNVFSAGGDITSFKRDASEVINGRVFGNSDFRAPFEAIETLEKPVIAAVDGTALAGGFELALVSDFVVVGERVEVGTPESKIGIAPGVAYVRLVREIAHHRAMEIMMTGDSITGQEAVDMGLFNEAVPVEEVVGTVDEYVHRLDQVAPVALTVIKKVANRHRSNADTVVSDLGLGVLLETEDAKKGFEAFQKGERPEFDGT